MRWRSAKLPAATAFLANRDRLEPAHCGHFLGLPNQKLRLSAKSSAHLAKSGRGRHEQALAHQGL